MTDVSLNEIFRREIGTTFELFFYYDDDYSRADQKTTRIVSGRKGGFAPSLDKEKSTFYHKILFWDGKRTGIYRTNCQTDTCNIS